MQDFRELKVWQKAHALTLAVYQTTSAFPREEVYGITSQMRRAVTSIPANLAEGRCRRSDRDFSRFVGIALGSASEVEYLLLLARDLEFLPPPAYATLSEQAEEVKRMLSALYDRLCSSGDA
jgi:four helix bundle protein